MGFVSVRQRFGREFLCVCANEPPCSRPVFFFFFFPKPPFSVSQAGVGAATAQPAEAHMAASQRSVPGVAAAPHEGHAEDRERAVVGAAPPGGGDEEEGPGAQSLQQSQHVLLSVVYILHRFQ